MNALYASCEEQPVDIAYSQTSSFENKQQFASIEAVTDWAMHRHLCLHPQVTVNAKGARSERKPRKLCKEGSLLQCLSRWFDTSRRWIAEAAVFLHWIPNSVFISTFKFPHRYGTCSFANSFCSSEVGYIFEMVSREEEEGSSIDKHGTFPLVVIAT